MGEKRKAYAAKPEETEGPCLLPESVRQCAGGPGYEEICRKCGFYKAEFERRRGIPLTKAENGLRTRDVSRPE